MTKAGHCYYWVGSLGQVDRTAANWAANWVYRYYELFQLAVDWAESSVLRGTCWLPRIRSLPSVPSAPVGVPRGREGGEPRDKA